jgi:MSHA biogenesis protein MshP
MMKSKFKNQLGVSLITAIFLIVVLASLGAMMSAFFAAQQQSSALDVLGSRAYQASRAGIEWGSYQVLQNTAAGFALACRGGPLNANIPQLGGTLAGFNVNVGCTYASVLENGVTVGIYRLVSLASSTGMVAGNPDYVERQISATIEN